MKIPKDCSVRIIDRYTKELYCTTVETLVDLTEESRQPVYDDGGIFFKPAPRLYLTDKLNRLLYNVHSYAIFDKYECVDVLVEGEGRPLSSE